MGSGDFAPDDSVLSALLGGLGLVDESNSSPVVPSSFLLVGHAIKLDQGGVAVLGTHASSETSDGSLDVQSSELL